MSDALATLVSVRNALLARRETSDEREERRRHVLALVCRAEAALRDLDETALDTFSWAVR